FSGRAQFTPLSPAVNGLFVRRYVLAMLPAKNAVKYGLMKIISGEQTGVYRAALDFAIRHGYEHGGWCPRGCLAEDGVIPPIYQLRETDSADYDERTEKNVLASDATLIVALKKE